MGLILKMHSLCASPFKCTIARKYRAQIPCLHKLVCCRSVDIIAQLVVLCISTNFHCYFGRKFWRQSHFVIIGKPKVRFSAWHAMTQSVSRVTAQASLNLGARWGYAINAKPRPLCVRERAQYPLYRGCMRSGAGLDGCGREKLAPTGVLNSVPSNL